VSYEYQFPHCFGNHTVSCIGRIPVYLALWQGKESVIEDRYEAAIIGATASIFVTDFPLSTSIS